MMLESVDLGDRWFATIATEASLVDGAEVAETVSVGHNVLKFLRAGLRKKISVKVYVGAPCLVPVSIGVCASIRRTRLEW